MRMRSMRQGMRRRGRSRRCCMRWSSCRRSRRIPLDSIGSPAGGDYRKRACSFQRRVGPKAQPLAGGPVPGSRVSASLPLCVCYTFEVFHAFCMYIIRSRNIANAAS